MELAHREQDRPAVQHGRGGRQLGDRHEALLDQQRQEVVAGAGGAGAGDGRGRLHHEGRVQLPRDQDESAGHPEHGLLGRGLLRGGGSGLGAGLVGADGPHGPLELLLGDLDDLRGQAAGVGEGEHGGLVPDEQDGAGALLLTVAGSAAGRAVVAARGGLPGQQAVGFFVADLGAYVVADVEHARHGWLPRMRCVAGPGGSRAVIRAGPGSCKDNGRSVAGVTPRGPRNRTARSTGSSGAATAAAVPSRPQRAGVERTERASPPCS